MLVGGHESTLDISRINCLRSLTLRMREKFAHQIEVLSRSDGLESQLRIREQRVVEQNISGEKIRAIFVKYFERIAWKKKLNIPVRSGGITKVLRPKQILRQHRQP